MTKTLVKIQALISDIPKAKKAIVPLATAVVGLVTIHFGVDAPVTIALTGVLASLGVFAAKNVKDAAKV